MKLTTITNVFVDGVMQGLGGSDEDRKGRFERGGSAIRLVEGKVFAGSADYVRAAEFAERTDPELAALIRARHALALAELG